MGKMPHNISTSRTMLKDEGIDSGGNCRNIARDQISARSILGNNLKSLSWRDVCYSLASPLYQPLQLDPTEHAFLADTLVCGDDGNPEYFLTTNKGTGNIISEPVERKRGGRQILSSPWWCDIKSVSDHFRQISMLSHFSSNHTARKNVPQHFAVMVDETNSLKLLDGPSLSRLAQSGLSSGIHTLSACISPRGDRGSGKLSLSENASHPSHGYCNFRHEYNLDDRAHPNERFFRTNVGTNITGTTSTAVVNSMHTPVNRKMSGTARLLLHAIESWSSARQPRSRRVTRLITEFVHDDDDNVWLIRVAACDIASYESTADAGGEKRMTPSPAVQNAINQRAVSNSGLSIQLRRRERATIHGNVELNGVNAGNTSVQDDFELNKVTGELPSVNDMNVQSSAEILGSTQLEQMCKGDFCGYDARGFLPTSMDLLDASAHDEEKNGHKKTPNNKEEIVCSSKFRSRLIQLEKESLVEDKGIRTYMKMTNIDNAQTSSSPLFDLPYSVILHARQEKHLVDLLLRRHRDGNDDEEIPYISSKGTDDYRLGESFPGHYYRSIKVCNTCYNIYNFLEKKRKSSIRKFESSNKTLPSYTKDNTIDQSSSSNYLEIDEPKQKDSITVERARRAISCVNKSDLAEIRSFVNPPPALHMVISALMIILRGEAKDWKASKSIFFNCDSLSAELAANDPYAMKPAQAKELERFVGNSLFRPEHIISISKAGAKLCAWVLGVRTMYRWNKGHFLHERLDPLQEFDALTMLDSSPPICRWDLLPREQDTQNCNSTGGFKNQLGSESIIFSENLEGHNIDGICQTNSSHPTTERSSTKNSKGSCKKDGNISYQQKRMSELAQTSQSLKTKRPTGRTLLCSDGVTRIPYEVLGGETVAPESGHINFVVCHDIFDCIDMTRVVFLDILKKHRGCRILVFNQPGQAGTTFPRQSDRLSGKEGKKDASMEKEEKEETTAMNNDFHAAKLYELMAHVTSTGEFGGVNSTDILPFHLLGIGNGFSVALSFIDLYGDTIFCTKSLKSVLSINGYTKVDEQLAAILHSTTTVMRSFPTSRPDLPVSYFSQFIFSSEYIEKVSRNLALNIYTAITNPISLTGRIHLASGALKNRDMTGVATKTHFPMLALQSTENLLVNASNMNDVMGKKDGIFRIWSHQIQHDTHQGKNCYARLGLVEKIQSLFLDNKEKKHTDGKGGNCNTGDIKGNRVAIFVRGGHTIMQECKWAVVDLFDLLACPIQDGTCNILHSPKHLPNGKARGEGKNKTKGRTKQIQKTSKETVPKSKTRKSPNKLRRQHKKVDSSIEAFFDVDGNKKMSSINKYPINTSLRVKKDIKRSSERALLSANTSVSKHYKPVELVKNNTNGDKLSPMNGDNIRCVKKGPQKGLDNYHTKTSLNGNSDKMLVSYDDNGTYNTILAKAHFPPDSMVASVDQIGIPRLDIEISSDVPAVKSEQMVEDPTNTTQTEKQMLDKDDDCLDLSVKNYSQLSDEEKTSEGIVNCDQQTCFVDIKKRIGQLKRVENQHQLDINFDELKMGVEKSKLPGATADADTISKCNRSLLSTKGSNILKADHSVESKSSHLDKIPTLDELLAMDVPIHCIPAEVLLPQPSAEQKNLHRWDLSASQHKSTHTKMPPTAEELEMNASLELESEIQREKQSIQNAKNRKCRSDMDQVGREQVERLREYMEEDAAEIAMLEKEKLRRAKDRARKQMQRQLEIDEADMKLTKSGQVPRYDPSEKMHYPVRTLAPTVYGVPNPLPTYVTDGGIDNVFKTLKRDAHTAKKMGILRVDEFEKIKGQMAQQHLEKEKKFRSMEESEKEKLFLRMATIIQRNVRGKIGRSRAGAQKTNIQARERMESAVIFIQKYGRGMLHRKRAGEARQSEIMQLVLGSSVSLIQRVWRGYRGRMAATLERRAEAVGKLQRVSRGHFGRNDARRERRRQEYERHLNDSALKIQCAWKVKVAWEEYQVLRVYRIASTEIQRLFRGYAGRKKAARIRTWEMTEPGPERIKLGIEIIKESKGAFERQQEEIDILHCAQEKAETRVSRIHDELRKAESELGYLEKEMKGIDHIESEIQELNHSRTNVLSTMLKEADDNSKIIPEQKKSQFQNCSKTSEEDQKYLEKQFRLKKAERDEKKKHLELELKTVLSEVEQKRNALDQLELSIANMEETRQRKEREFGRIQRDLMEFLHEQKNELDLLREKGIELETATATTATAAAATAQRAQEHEKQTGAMFSQQEELMKFQFMSMGLSYLSSLGILNKMRDATADATKAAVANSSDTAAAAAAAAAAASIPAVGSVHTESGASVEDKIAEKEAKLRKLQLECRNLDQDTDEPLSSDCRQWSIKDVSRWLTGLSLSQYVLKFEEACVDGDFLLDLQEEELANVLGVEHKLHRRKIMLAREKLKPLSNGEINQKESVINEEEAETARKQENMPDPDLVFSQARHGRLARLQVSLDNGFDINTEDEQGNTLLMVTVQNGHRKMMNFLVQRGANIDHINRNGNSALHFAFAYDKSGHMAEYLIERGADDTIENSLGFTPYDGIGAGHDAVK